MRWKREKMMWSVKKKKRGCWMWRGCLNHWGWSNNNFFNTQNYSNFPFQLPKSQQLSISKPNFQPAPKYSKLWFFTKFLHAVTCSELSSKLRINDVIYFSRNFFNVALVHLFAIFLILTYEYKPWLLPMSRIKINLKF